MCHNETMKKIAVIFGVLIVFNILAWLAVFGLRQSCLEVTFFDVGQGDSIFIETPQNHQILIDGGPTAVILEKLGKAMPFWDRTLDLVVLTHPDYDHLAGLIDVLERYRVENILWTGVLADTAEFKEWQGLIQEEGAHIYVARAGQRIKSSGTVLELLHPFESLEGKTVKNTNNTSIIARLVFGDDTFLFTGDAYQTVERELIGRGAEIDADVLKVGHHGSKNSSTREFIGVVSPEIAVISVGKDSKYGHPHQETLESLAGAEVLRTDEAGDIKIVSDGKNYQIKKR